MHTIETDVDRPDPELVSAFEAIPSSIVSDVTGNVGVAMDAGLGPVYRGAETAGTAVTVKAAPSDNLIIHKAITVADPGDVLVIDGGGYTGAAYLGELMCASCQAQGLAGVVIDGAIRDRADIEEMGFPLYARGVHPQGPFKQDPGSINVTVSCGGVSVDPGDIVVGDDDGVSVVPAEDAEAVLEASREKLESEADLRERVEAGEYLYEIGGYDEILENLNVVGPEDSAE
jgi:4-hydroxy-4-methyl-2-oxoglutarate aldolase